jgi:hypothetical protein
MNGTFIIKFTTEIKGKDNYNKDVFILGKFNNSESALAYLRKYYNHDVTNGDKNVKVIEESLHNTERKNGDIECYVKKVYQYDFTTYTELMEIEIPFELCMSDDPIKDINALYN